MKRTFSREKCEELRAIAFMTDDPVAYDLIVEAAELLSEARELDLIIHSLRTEATSMSSKLDNAMKYIKRLKETK